MLRIKSKNEKTIKIETKIYWYAPILNIKYITYNTFLYLILSKQTYNINEYNKI